MSHPMNKAMQFSEQFEIANNELGYEYLEKSFGYLAEEFKELEQALKNKDDIEILDGAYDVAFVAINIAYKLIRQKGFKDLPARARNISGFLAVCENNLTKLDENGKVIKDENGKIISTGDDEFNKVDYFWKTNKGYVCDILRRAYNVWKWDKHLETQWDRQYFQQPENRSRKEIRATDKMLVEKYFKE